MRWLFVSFAALMAYSCSHVDAYTYSTMTMNMSPKTQSASSSRRAFLSAATASAAAVITAGAVQGTTTQPANAAPQIFTTGRGVKYAVLKEGPSNTRPSNGDIVAIEYTGYLSNGNIFDGTHAEGKSNVLLFNLGGNAVIEGLNDMVSEMKVGQKVQCIIPPSLAFGDKGICLENGECLVKPGSTLVYDVYLKKSAIPPP